MLKWTFTVLCLIISSVTAFRDNDLTAQIPAGKTECFYQPVKAGLSLEVEYQVVNGGDLDISFIVNGPDGNALVTERRRNDGIHTVNPTVAGDYEICFSNTFSRFTDKTVFFEIIIDNDSEDYPDVEDEEWKKATSPEDAAESQLATLEMAEDSVVQIKTNNAKSLQLQGLLRVFEAKDRNIAERNYRRINFWSVVNVIIMIGVFCVQVMMVRHMFSDNRKVRT